MISWFQSEHAYPNLGAIFGSGVKVVVDEELGTNVLGESIAELQRSKMTSATRKIHEISQTQIVLEGHSGKTWKSK